MRQSRATVAHAGQTPFEGCAGFGEGADVGPFPAPVPGHDGVAASCCSSRARADDARRMAS